MVRPTYIRLIGFLMTALCLVSHGRAENTPTETPSTADSKRQSQRQLAIIDPRTGQAVSGERAIRNMDSPGLRTELGNFNARLKADIHDDFSSAGLKEQPLANGAVKVDLQGRFRSPLIAISPPGASVSITHHPPAIRNDR